MAQQQDDSYGTRKRLRFIDAAIEVDRPRTILDIGCGLGAVSLAVAARHPDIRITAVDSDPASINQARAAGHPGNLEFLLSDQLPVSSRFDLIIASEVLEHVDEPELFLRRIGDQLEVDGRLLLTVPNGYGPYEIMSFVEGGLKVARVYAALRTIKRRLRPARAASDTSPITLAVSPHVNFFSWQGLRRLLARSGYAICQSRSRTFLCGFGLDQLLRAPWMLAWNASVADRLPPAMSSDWMLLLRRDTPNPRLAPWRNGLWGRVHRTINQRCLGLSSWA